MAVYPLQFPNISPSSQKLQIVVKQSVALSPFTGHQQTNQNYAQWALSFTWPVMMLPRAEVAQAWLDTLSGQLGSFLYRPYQNTASALTGRTLAGGGFQYADSMTIGGWGANAASSLNVGQYLQIGTQLLRIASAPVRADAAGRCVVSFAPFLRFDYPAGTAVNFTNPRGLFRLNTGETPSFSLAPGWNAEFPPIDAMEAL